MFKNIGYVICDIQSKVMPHIKNPDRIIQNTITLIEANKQYRRIHASEKAPIVVAELLPKKLGLTVNAIKSQIEPMKLNVYNIEKETYSIHSNQLAQALREDEVKTILLSGVQTEWCITKTAEDFLEDGFKVIVCSDTVSSTNQHEHIEALNRLSLKNIWITTTHGFITQRLQHVEHPISRWYVSRLKQLKDA